MSNKTLATLDEALKLIGEKPAKMTGRLYDLFIENFRKDLAEIREPGG